MLSITLLFLISTHASFGKLHLNLIDDILGCCNCLVLCRLCTCIVELVVVMIAGADLVVVSLGFSLLADCMSVGLLVILRAALLDH